MNVTFARVRVHDREVSHVWLASVKDLPDGKRLIPSLRRPFMNFREGREQLAVVLGVEPTRVPFDGSTPGIRIWHPKDSLQELAILEDKPVNASDVVIPTAGTRTTYHYPEMHLGEDLDAAKADAEKHNRETEAAAALAKINAHLDRNP